MEALELSEAQNTCTRQLEMLGGLGPLHLEIDFPARVVEEDEPDWVLRLRKVYFHVVASAGYAVTPEGLHAMATEVRAAHVQMDAIWERLPNEAFEDIDPAWWTSEASEKLLAAFDHPTPLGLEFSLAVGGLQDVESPIAYARMAIWLGRLGLGYGCVLSYLARFLGAEEELRSRVDATLVELLGAATIEPGDHGR
ncbi:MAG: hypothetical protein OXG81_02925 [Acidobacteria bacterium]|nr:hypothetical protein [Acidobacteriota bacterium]